MKQDVFEQLLNDLRQHADPVHGFFGPESITWQINRENVIYLSGMRALLLQIAHPAVAEGVAHHSRFRQDPFGRAIRTFHTVHAIVFGRPDEALKAARRAFAIHARVQGRTFIEESERTFVATDDDLLLWVYATLVDSAMLAYRLFLPDLPRAEWERAYEEGKRVGLLFGLSPEAIPPTLGDFETYMHTMLNGSTLQVTPSAREIALALHGGTWWLRLIAPLNRLIAAATLPEHLRTAFDLPWSSQREWAFRLFVAVVRRTVPYLPPHIRYVPAARQAWKRIHRTRRT
nr:oxygenase MpaB family protein [Ardenticatena sp.]